jgi:hypothetical protein
MLVVALAAAEAAPPPPPVGVTRQESPGAARFEAVLPGRLLSYALPKGLSGRREILLLVGPEPEEVPAPEKNEAQPSPPEPCDKATQPEHETLLPRLLLRLDLTDEGGTLATLRGDLPPDSAFVDAIDLEGDGIEEIVLGRPGELLVLRDSSGRRAAGGPDLLMKDPYILPGTERLLEPWIIRYPAIAGVSILPLDILGGVRFYGPRDQGRSWDLLQEAALPMEAQLKEGSLRVESPRVRVAGRRPDGRILFASGPEAYGKQRLRSLLIDPMASGEARRVECWSLLPGLEEVIEAQYLLLEGRPALLVTTRSARKLSLFGEKMLRLFRLDESDRSRTGGTPLLAVDSHMNLWQSMRPVARDVDGDGREDLVIGYWKGLKDSRVVLDAYMRKEDGSFDRSPVTTDFDVERGDRSILDYRGDLDGDGRADLLLAASGAAQVFAGSPVSREGKGLVERKARWSIPLSANAGARGRGSGGGTDFQISIGGKGSGFSSWSDGDGSPRPVDLDGDGRAEILIAAAQVRGRGLLQVIRLTTR